MNEQELQMIAQELYSNRQMTNEVIWANIFHDTIKSTDWIKNQPFSPGRAAIGYPTLYALFRILDEFKPKRILEMGLGQSTKMIGSYVKHQEQLGNACKHYVVEHDEDWINFFKNIFELSPNTEIVHLDLNKITLDTEVNGEQTEINMYASFQERFKDNKFDLIFIDGPFGSPLYSRIDIIDILPECLNESFILMLDDAERRGEQNTLKMITNILQENQIDYARSYYSGMKSTAIITSKNLHFFCTM